MAKPSECEENVFKMMKEGEDHAIFGELEDLGLAKKYSLDYHTIEKPLIAATINAKKEKTSPISFIKKVCVILTQAHRNIDFKQCEEIVCESAANYKKWSDKDDYWEKRWSN